MLNITTERQAVQLLRQKIKRIYCPRCMRKRYVRSLPGGTRYYCQKCRYKFSFKVLLGLKNCKLTYMQIVKSIYCFSERKTLRTTMDMANISYVTARYVYSRFRNLLPQITGKLAGDVIVDECFIGKQKTENQVIVAGAVSRCGTYLKIQLVSDREQGTLEQFLVTHVRTDSLVTTDCLTSYGDIEWLGYGHQRDNHSKGQLKLSCPIERVWAEFKTLLRRTYHHIWKESIHEYLVEFEARFNHRHIVNNPSNLLTYLLNPVPSA